MADEWIHIFRGGLQTDSQGREHYWTDQELSEIAGYNPAVFASPITINHSNKRRFGQVGEVKKIGQDIYFKPAAIDENFIQAFRGGFFQKPSIEIDHNFDGKGRKYLVGVSFLEGHDPAVEGLEPAYFSKNISQQVSIYGLPKGRHKEDGRMALEDLLQQKESEIKAKDAEIARFQAEGSGLKKSLEDKDKELTAKDAELKAKDAELARFQAQAAAGAREARKLEISQFCKQLSESAGWQAVKLAMPPAWEDAGLVEFMASLDGSTVAKFSKADGSKEETPLAFFKRFLTEELPKAFDGGKLWSEFARNGVTRAAKADEQDIAEAKAIAAIASGGSTAKGGK